MASNFIQAFQPLLKNQSEPESKNEQNQAAAAAANREQPQNNNLYLQNSNKKAHEYLNLSMKRNYEVPNFHLQCSNNNNKNDVSVYNIGGDASTSPRDHSATF